MFPLYDTIRTSRFPFLNWAIVLITVYVFFLQLTTPDVEAFIYQYALVPSQVNFSNLASLLPFITAIFLHGGLLHIISNMWFLIVFGDNVNDALSPFGFLLLYFSAGIIGNVVQYMFTPQSDIPMLGASGAVAGILGCYYVLFPHAKIKTLVIVIFFVTIIEISAPLVLGYWFVLQLFSGAASIPTLGAETGGVAFFAHIAGFVVGLLFGYFYKNKAHTGELYE
jgi:membrane associated rhomboid family serine protease